MMVNLNDEERIQVLLVEYTASQNSAQHHDSLVWNAIGMIWAAQLVLLGFIIQAINNSLISFIMIVSCGLALILLVFLLIEYFSFRKIRNHKYDRCKQIEKELGLKQHSSLSHKSNLGTISFSFVTALFIVVWALVILTIVI